LATARAERAADCQLVSLPDRPNQQQVRQVHGRNQQHETDGAPHHDERPLDVSYDVGRERRNHRTIGFIRVRKAARQIGGD
jgi:hypothetical protein